MIFPFRPQQGMTEKIVYENTILTAYDSTEQRINKQGIPNSIFSFDIKKTQLVSNFINAMMLSNRDSEFELPIWTDLSIYGAISKDLTELSFDTSMKRYMVGSYLFIWDDDFHYEIVETASITATKVTFVEPIQNDYNNAYIMPAYVSYMMDNPTIAYNHNTLNTASFTFICAMLYEFENYVFEDALNYTPIYFDCELFADNTGQNNYIGSSTIQNYGGGVLDLYKKWCYAKVTRSYGFKKTTKEDIWNLRVLFHYLKGSWKPIYIPTFKDDLVVSGNISRYDKFLNIKNCNYNQLLNDIKVRKYIVIFYENTYIIKRILNFSPNINDSNFEICNLIDPVGEDIDCSNCKISFLVPYRSASDVFELKWNRLDYVECYNNFTEEYMPFIYNDIGCLAMAEIQLPLEAINEGCLAMEEIQ